MAYTTINKSTDYFNTKLYTGNGSTQNITGVGFQPDWTWIKARAASGTGNDNHSLCDVVRTKGSYGYPSIYTNLTSAEYDPASGNEVITDFISDGFSLGGNENSNYNSNTYVSWNWKANGQGSSNTDGSITSTVSANTTAGFSIVKWTAPSSGANTDTIGHGLSAVPKMIIVKTTSSTDAWRVYHNVPGIDKHGSLNNTNGFNSNTNIFPTLPTTSVFYPGSDASVNSSSRTYVAYCFAEKTGYSKFGSYTGNGSTDGVFIYCGFKPTLLLIKRTDTAKNWFMHDNKRKEYNPESDYLSPNLTATEADYDTLDILSNGFKIRQSGTGHNESGGTYAYMAIGQSLVGSNNVPCTAR